MKNIKFILWVVGALSQLCLNIFERGEFKKTKTKNNHVNFGWFCVHGEMSGQDEEL